jgi:hypothetical protein
VTFRYQWEIFALCGGGLPVKSEASAEHRHGTGAREPPALRSARMTSSGNEPYHQSPSGAEFLGDSLIDPGPRPPKSRRTALIAGAAAAAVMLGAAGAGAVVLGSLSGGGARPADRLPAGAMYYTEIDLDPGAGQKVGAIRFIRKFPALKDSFAEDRDLRRSLWDLAAKGNDASAEIDYAKDIEPWLGQRVGLAVMAPAAGDSIDEGDVVAAVQVTDEDKALDGIRRLNAMDEDGDDVFATALDGYLVLAADQASADRYARAADERSLADDATFKADLDGLGERGILSGWVDVRAMGRAVAQSKTGEGMSGDGMTMGGSSAEMLAKQLEGRFAFGVRFDGDDLELVADGRGMSSTKPLGADGSASVVKDLPDGTLAALGVAHGEQAIRDGWPRFLEQLEQMPMPGTGSGPGAVDEALRAVEEQTGVDLPDDLAVLFGSDFALGAEAGEGFQPRIGARARTDGARAESVIGKLIGAGSASGVEVPVVVQRTDDGYVVAGDQAYADALKAGGRLGDTAGFKAALPDADKADMLLYVDIDGALDGARDMLPMDSLSDPDLRALDGVGMTASSDGDGDIRIRVKVVTK